MAKRFWRIRGHRGTDTFFDDTVPIGSLMDSQVKELIKCLAAKEGLTLGEIMGAYVKRNTKRANDLLHIEKKGPYPEYSCGNNPFFTAIVVDEEGERVKYPVVHSSKG